MKDKLKSYEFWVSVVSAVLVVLQTLSMKLDIPRITEFTTAFLGALSVAGILKKNKVKSNAAAETADGGEVGEVLPPDEISYSLADKENREDCSKEYKSDK
jgi:uncharacterized membrane protein